MPGAGAVPAMFGIFTSSHTSDDTVARLFSWQVVFENESADGSALETRALTSSLRTRRTHSMNNMKDVLLSFSSPASELRAVKELANERDTIDDDDLNMCTPRNTISSTTKST